MVALLHKLWGARFAVKLRHVMAKSGNVLLAQGSRGQNPVHVFMLLWAVLSGLAYTLGAPPPNSVTEPLPDWAVTVWYLVLFTGGAISLAGIAIPDVLYSLLVERAGTYMLGPAGSLYAVALFSSAGWRALGAGGITAAFSIACLFRWWQITLLLARIKAELAEAAKRASLGAQSEPDSS